MVESICPQCGMTLPLAGRICPYCHADLSVLRKAEGDAATCGCYVFVIILAISILYRLVTNLDWGAIAGLVMVLGKFVVLIAIVTAIYQYWHKT